MPSRPAGKIIRKVMQTLSRFEMLCPGDRVIAAVSGGADSVCLLHILHGLQEELGIELIVAHYDHGFRPEEDESETRFVRGLAKGMGLGFHSEKGELSTRTNGASLEEIARDARYAFLDDLSEKLKAHKIAVGHTLNDQAETVIMRLLRGSGPSGLAGIPPVRGRKIIRPLIGIKRDEILSYLEQTGLSYKTDSSNLQTRFLRNKIRLDLMPHLLAFQPRLIEHLGDLAHILRDEDHFMDLQAEKWLKDKAVESTDEAVQIPIAPFLALPHPLRSRVVRRLLLKARKDLRRIVQRHILSISRLAEGPDPQAEIHLPGGLTIKKVYGLLSLSSDRNPETMPSFSTIDGPGTYPLKDFHCTLLLETLSAELDPFLRKGPQKTALVDADKIRYPLLVRNPQPGDRFVPLGMKGHRKVKDFFIDLKVPSEKRARTPILFSRDEPVWICGYRIDDRFKVTPDTKSILKMTLYE